MADISASEAVQVSEGTPHIVRSPGESVLEADHLVITLMNAAPCLIVVLDRNGRIIRFNQACCELTGYTFEEVRGRTVWDTLLPSEQIEPVKAVFRRLVTEEPAAGDIRAYPHTYQNDWVSRDGSRRSILWSNDYVRNDHGQVVTIVAAGLDITERTRIEAALRASEDRYRSLVEHASVCIKELDLNGRIMTMNAAGLRILGIDDEQEIVGKGFVDCVSEPDRDRLKAQLARAYAGESSELEFTTEYFGRPLVLASSLIPVHRRDGTIQKIVSVTQDVTDGKRAQQRLIEQESLVRLGQMMAVIAHEVKNPLAGIRGALQVIGSRFSQDTPEHTVLHDAVARVDSLADMIQDMLTFARPNPPRLVAVALRPVLEGTVTLAQQDPVLANVSVELKGDRPTVLGDGEQLSRVFLNLILNAAQAMDGKGEIEVNIQGGERHCVVSVSDTGPGVPSEVRDRLFEPFVTSKRRGTGLGLATAKRTVDLHGGTITVDVPARGGTIVTVVLPITQTPV